MKLVPAALQVLFAGALVLLSISCSQVAPAEPADLRLELLIEGGITGRGDGGVTIQGNEVTSIDAFGEECTVVTDLSRLRRSVETLDSRLWGSSLISRGADMFTYVLTMESNGRTRTLRWDDGAELPDELRELARALHELRRKALESC